MHQNQTRKPLKTSRWEKPGNVYASPRWWRNFRGFGGILLEVTNCKANEYYCIQPWKALKKISQLHKTINETFLVNAKKADR